MFEELKSIIDKEYDKIEMDEQSSTTLEDINKQINEQNKKVEEEVNNSKVVNDYLQKHNKNNISELSQKEINELLDSIDKEIEKMEWGDIVYDIIIIGAGPAGLTAALYARRANKKVLVLEKKNYGGQIINTPSIENYPALPNISGFDFATNLYNQVTDLGAEIKYEEVTSIEDTTVITNKDKYQTKKIIIATGTTNRKLNIGEEKYLGKGVSFCATCDGAFFKNKIVAVVGAGNTALEDALYLSNIASKVYIIHHNQNIRGEKKYQDEIKNKHNIEYFLDYDIIKLEGENNLEKIIIKNKLGEEQQLEISGLFIAIGQLPESDIFKDVVELNSNNYIKTNDEVHTKNKDIYVAGDVREKSLRQLTTAVADGSLAATIAINEMED